MDTLPFTVAFLHDPPLTPEQEAALARCDRAAAVVEPVTLDDVAVGRRDLSRFDVCWWHRDEPLEPAVGADALSDAVGAFLDAGGGLLLSLHALSGVEPLGVDDVPPDATGVEAPPGAAGLAARTLHRDHPLFEALGDRVRTDDGGERPFAAYESVLPAAGEVLACEFRGEDLLVERKSAVSWRVGEGSVLGVGSGLRFAPSGGDAAGEGAAGATADGGERLAAAVDRLLRNALAVLGGDRRPAVGGRPRDADQLRALRERLDGDHLRPAYHLTAPANWLNDPNGLIEWNGRYHVFYQYNPAGPFHGTIHWGHAVSDDLVRWRDEPVALTPSADGPDRDGCWSGCAVDDDGTPTALYTGGRGRHQLPCLATDDDGDLQTWTKSGANPVINAPPEGLDVIGSDRWDAEFRDHCVWRRGPSNADAGPSSGADGDWLHLVGSGVEGEGGAALLYRGESLDEWEYVGPLLAGDAGTEGAMWECPELLELGGADLLHVSNYEEVRYYLGEADFDEPSFEVDREGRLDFGDFYAPQSMRVGGDRYLTFGWLPESRDLDAQWEAGWSGALSLPRELSVGSDGRLRQRPASELTALREERLVDREAERIDAGSRRPLDVRDNAYELRAEVRLDPDGDGGTSETAFELAVCESPARSERTVIRFDGEALVVDRSESSSHPGVDRSELRLPLGDDGGSAAERLSLRAFVDGSVLELFANGRRCLAARVYPTRPDATGASAAAVGGDVAVESLDVWSLGSAWT